MSSDSPSVLSKSQLKRLANAGYSLVGPSKHSAIKVCLWSKNSITGKGHCYKQKFYGIQSHRCLQFTPALPFCSHKCVFCWRDTSITFPKWTGCVDSPDKLIDEAIASQRKLLTGFKGNEKADLQKWKQAQDPAHVAISLAGEPCLYPELRELLSAFRKRGMTTFLVTNGLYPEVLRQLEEQNALPTQLYVSLASHNSDNYMDVHKPLLTGGWTRFNESLELLSSLSGKTRTVLRMTLAKGVNMTSTDGYAKLIEKSNAQYVEVKAYMALGSSRERLGVSAMPFFEDIKSFAAELAKQTSYLKTAEHQASRVVLLCRDEKSVEKRKIKS
ncbi:MAG: 4-demethylwyosine synthase TYW1 [Candidatus Micrarchaeia archaeon]